MVYIATPHSHHAEHMKLCIAYKKPILCEKAFTATAAQAREVLEYAKEQKVFVAEAIWTRYMPSRNIIKETMESGIIGEIHSLTANLGYSIDHVERMQEPSLAGGALLDLGVYPINFAVMCFGEEIESITSTAILTEKGVDKSNSITLCYKNGQMAVLHSNFYVTTDRRGIIYGNKGFIEVTNINNCEKIEVFDVNRNKIKEMEIPAQISGFEYEVLACKRALQEGKLECAEM